MKIYRISQNINDGYDTYDSAVVAADNEEDARNIHPSQFVTHFRGDKWYGTYSSPPIEEYETENDVTRCWVLREDLDTIKVEYLGEATDTVKRGVILASFNAG
jgi:hypothetical protein